MPWVFVAADVVANPIVIETDAAVVFALAIATHFRFRTGATTVRDALAPTAVKQHAGVGCIGVLFEVIEDTQKLVDLNFPVV